MKQYQIKHNTNANISETKHVRYRLKTLERANEAETLDRRADEVLKSGGAPSAALPDVPASADPGKSVRGHRL